MQITTFTNFRQNLDSFLSNVSKNHEPLFVTRPSGEDVVILSKEDYNSLMETFYLLQSPKNAERLNLSIQQYKEGFTAE